MYKVNYLSGKGKTEILLISQKQDNHWIELHDTELQSKIEERYFKITHFSQEVEKVGYGEFFLTAELRFITGSFDYPESF